MSITSRLLADVAPQAALATVQDVRIGAFWVAVLVSREGQHSCGLASAMRGLNHHQRGHFPIRSAGSLLQCSAAQLAGLIESPSLLEASVGMATINALLQVDEGAAVELNASEAIARRGADKNVVVIGHFPFIGRLRDRVGKLWVLELRPGPDDRPATDAPELIPQADVVAITSTALINGTLDGLLTLCRPDAYVLLLGPSTPMTPLVFDHGVDVLSGTLVDDIATVLRLVSQGATFQQIHRQGVRLVTMAASR
jgi:uncharacterized protein (DUF4213/DUF364 family)